MKNYSAEHMFKGERNPFKVFLNWLDEASRMELNDPDAIALATVDQSGLPNVRMVLLRKIERDSFIFFTNYGSKKSNELKSGKAAFVCHWKSIRRQVRVRGVIEKEDTVIADDYFASRSEGSKLGAWASKQSAILEDKQLLFDRIESIKEKYGAAPPRPKFWGGFRLKPLEIEFWQDGEHRLHDRFLWRRKELSEAWIISRLYP
ncbi:MAG: pyridoxamine 5'-phosphate oxidase [Pseudomonadota bacterium]|nr:pyridoxamine 5'-phosphate oxidase [Pseudomonadota bacterium]